jgi:hypothetical protein
VATKKIQNPAGKKVAKRKKAPSLYGYKPEEVARAMFAAKPRKAK